MDALRKKKDITWTQVQRDYVHGFETYVESVIVDISKEYFSKNAKKILGP